MYIYTHTHTHTHSLTHTHTYTYIHTYVGVDLRITTYKVTATSIDEGLVEWVEKCFPLVSCFFGFVW